MGININIYNILLFKFVWLSCVLTSGTSQSGLISIGVVVLVLWLHFRFIAFGMWEMLFVAKVALIGFFVDTLMFNVGALYLDGSSKAGLSIPVGSFTDRDIFTLVFPPIWMICLWINFACIVNHSLRFLRDMPWLAFLTGAFSGPIAYIGGASLSYVTIGHNFVFSIAALALTWAFIVPGCFKLAQRCQRKRWNSTGI